MKYLEAKLSWIVGVGPDCKHSCKTEAEEDYTHTHTHTHTHTLRQKLMWPQAKEC